MNYRYLLSLFLTAFLFLPTQAQTYPDFGNQSSLVSFTTTKAAGETFTFTLAPDETSTRPQWPIVFIDWSGTNNRQMINLNEEQSFAVLVPESQVVTITGENGLWTVMAVDQSITEAKTSDASILRHLYLEKNLLGKDGSPGSDYANNLALETLSLSANYYKELPVATNTQLQVLHADSNRIKTMDLTGLDQLKRLSLSRNLITEIKMPQNTDNFSYIDLRVNRMNIATLPTMPAGMEASQYHYTLQERYKLPKDKFKIAEPIDLSDQNNARGVTGSEQPTTYEWYVEINPSLDNYRKLEAGVDYTVQNGISYFQKNIYGDLFVAMTTPAFPGLESFERKVDADSYAFEVDGNEQIQFQPDMPDISLPYYGQINDMVDGRIRKVYRSNNMVLDLNYWHGTLSNDWRDAANWTGNYVPLTLLADAGNNPDIIEDVEFATKENNNSNKPNSGSARRNLHVPSGENRVVRNLINASETGKATVITPGSSFRILNKVLSEKAHNVYGDVDPAYRLLVMSEPLKPNGTLTFDDPSQNADVYATVEFYSKGYDGNFDKQHAGWQYFGTPVRDVAVAAVFPEQTIVRKYEQGKNDEYDEKWVAALPTDIMQPFHGYEITQPVPATYLFKGRLNFEAPSDLSVAAPVDGVPYGAFNAFANSYTAAYDISKIGFGDGLEQTVYLYNTGSRLQWIDNHANPLGAMAGQYVAIPVGAAATIPELPKEIPSLQSFVVKNSGTASATLTMPYSGVIKEAAQLPLRSETDAQIDGYMLIDIASERGADRMILIQKPGTSRGFDNAWDGTKLFAEGRPQIYAMDQNKAYQVSSSDQLDGTPIGFRADETGSYTVSFVVDDQLWTKHEALYLRDRQTGALTAINNDATYTFTGSRGQDPFRFELVSGEAGLANSVEAGIRVYGLDALRLRVDNTTALAAQVNVYDVAGRLVHTAIVAPRTAKDLTLNMAGNYVVQAGNISHTSTTKVMVQD